MSEETVSPRVTVHTRKGGVIKADPIKDNSQPNKSKTDKKEVKKDAD